MNSLLKTFERHEQEDLRRENKIREQFLDWTGLEAVEIHQSFPFDRSVLIHTEDQTFTGMLTEGGKQLMQGSLQEEK